MSYKISAAAMQLLRHNVDRSLMLELPEPFLFLPTHIEDSKGQRRQTRGIFVLFLPYKDSFFLAERGLFFLCCDLFFCSSTDSGNEASEVSFYFIYFSAQQSVIVQIGHSVGIGHSLG